MVLIVIVAYSGAGISPNLFVGCTRINLIYPIYIIEQKIAERLGCLVRQFHEICHFQRNVVGWNNTSEHSLVMKNDEIQNNVRVLLLV